MRTELTVKTSKTINDVTIALIGTFVFGRLIRATLVDYYLFELSIRRALDRLRSIIYITNLLGDVKTAPHPLKCRHNSPPDWFPSDPPPVLYSRYTKPRPTPAE